MASHKDSNSSKTAHVMNLLSKSRGSAPAPEAEPREEPAAESVRTDSAPVSDAAPKTDAAPPAKTPPVAPLISSLNADAAVSSQIKDALESELGAELAELAAETPAAPEPEEVPEEVVVFKAPVEVASSADEWLNIPAAPEPEPEPEPVPEPEAELPAEPPAEPEPPAPASVSEAPAEADPLAYQPPSYTNVMELLVDEKAEKYMRMFGLCCCDKCQVDVKAYALNHLPPKYVVMADQERVPKLTVYESKYSSDVTAQLIQACKIVMTTPHHTR